MDLDRTHLLEEIGPFVEAGIACHWLKPKSKAPVENAWSDAPVATLGELRNLHHEGNNVGVRLGEPSRLGVLYLHLIDLDIRDAKQAGDAWAKLLELWPQARAFPFVISGSGGESRHIYLVTERPFRSKKLARSLGFSMVFDKAKGRDVKKFDWEIELFGTGKQAVLPPSIHPDTGLPYRWGRPLDLESIEMGVGPLVTTEVVRSWAAQRDETSDEPVELRPALGLSEVEAREILNDLPFDEWVEDRDGWLQAGMALHHEFGGAEVGLRLWNEFSIRSQKYDAKDQGRVWKSFKAKTNSVRMATLKKAAQAARFEAMFEEEPAYVEPELPIDTDEDDPFDLLGEALAPISDEIDDLLGDPAAILPAIPHPDPKWKEKLDRNDEGAIKPTLHNVTLIIGNDPRTRGVPQFNLFTQEVVIRGAPGTLKMIKDSPKGTKQLVGPVWRLEDSVNGDLWSDAHDSAIRDVIEAPIRQGGYAIKVSDRDLHAAVNLAARANAFHPVREYLEGLTWDGVPRLETLFTRFLGAEDNAYTRRVAWLTLVAGVVRVYEPGHKYDFALILEGVQGKRKSTFIEVLGGHWFAELNGNFHDRKEMVERMQGSWILELPELQGFSKAEVQDIKAFISARTDKVRLAYARRAQLFKRQCIFIGSTNEGRYLRDNTGGRRFWPVLCHVSTIDIDALHREVDQLWAEAVQGYRDIRQAQPFGTLPLYLNEAAAAAEAIRLQEDRRVEQAEDAIAGRIEAWLDSPTTNGFDDDERDDLIDGPAIRTATCLLEIWVECFGKPIALYDQKASQLLGRSMKDVSGWVSDGTQQRTEKYGKQRVYHRLG